MKVSESSQISIGKLALRVGVCVGTIRRWCREGKLKETSRTPGNHRRFAYDDFKHILPAEDSGSGKLLVMPESLAMTRNQI